MKRIISVFLALFMLCSFASSASALEYGEEWANYNPKVNQLYSDVPSDHWAFKNIARVSEKNWFSGYPDGTFRPNGQITRAEALKVFVVFLGLQLKDVTTSSYHDVRVTDWYAPYIEAGKDLFPPRLSISGSAPFQPNMPVTREDTIYALVKALGYEDETQFADQSILNMFSDKESISHHIKPYAAVAVQKELVAGRTDGTIGAQDPLTRAEFATLLYRASYFGFNTVQSKLQSVSLNTPARVTMQPGDTLEITATATYSDGTTTDYVNLNPYNNDSNNVVNINRNTITAANPGNCEIRFNDENLKDVFIVIIVQEVGSAPSINIYPYEDETSSTSATIQGHINCETTNGLTLTCNGDGIYVQPDGSFSVTLPLEEGTNRFRFVATNSFGEATDNVTIKREEEGTAPRITFNSYDNRTNEETITISGKVTSNTDDPIDLTCNGSNVNLQSNGKFSVTLDLSEGSNYFDFEAMNRYGNTNKTIEIKMEVTGSAPIITLEDYDTYSEEESVMVEGKVISESREDFSLSCNGTDVYVYANGTFKFEVFLEEGENQIDFVATNRFGETVETIYIERLEEPSRGVEVDVADPEFSDDFDSDDYSIDPEDPIMLVSYYSSDSGELHGYVEGEYVEFSVDADSNVDFVNIGNVIMFSADGDYIQDAQVLFTSDTLGIGSLSYDLDNILTDEFSNDSVSIHYGEITDKAAKSVTLDGQKFYFADNINVLIMEYTLKTDTKTECSMRIGSLSSIKPSNDSYVRTAFVKTALDIEDEITDIVVFIESID